jgi:pentatricopeptide repeat protein
VLTWLTWCYRARGAIIEAMGVLDEMAAYSVLPDTATYNELINICVEGSDLGKAEGLLTAMEDRNLPPDATTFSTLIKGYGQAGNLSQALRCFDDMISAGVRPTTYVCNALADVCIRCGEPARAGKLFDEWSQEAPRDARSFNILLKALRAEGDVKRALPMVGEMEAEGVLPDAVTFNTLIDLCGKAGMVEEARDLLEQMGGRGLRVDPHTVHPLAHAMIMRHRPVMSLDEARGLATSLLGQYDLLPNAATTTMVRFGCDRVGRLIYINRDRSVVAGITC